MLSSFIYETGIGRFRPVKFPFCIFGLADLTVSKVFFSSLPLRKEVSHQDRAENYTLALVAVFVLEVYNADRVMLVKLKEKFHNAFRSEYLIISKETGIHIDSKENTYKVKMTGQQVSHKEVMQVLWT